MNFIKVAKVTSAAAIVMAVMTGPVLADGNCGVGVGLGNAKCSRTGTGSVAPLPALGTGLPGLIVLVGGLVLLARRRRG
jgi:hypothetical protein